MEKRPALQKYIPDAYKLLKELDGIVKNGIEPITLELIKIRASQLNGCAYCLNKHTTDAIALGADQQRLNVLSAWREAKKWFTAEEQVVLLITEEVTRIGEHGISDEVYEKGLGLLGEEKLAYVIMAAININAWNRIGVGASLHPVKYS